MSHQRHQHRTRQDLARLRRLLTRALDLSPSSSPPPKSDIHLLDLACGACTEAELLVNLFSQPGTPTADACSPAPQARLVGVDIRAREIAEAEARCRAYLRERQKSGLPAESRASSPLPGNSEPIRENPFEFLAADATRVTSHRQLPDHFDIVFMRHQNYYDGPDLWKKIFAQGFEKLSSDGVLILTSYFDREHELALEAIANLGGELVTSLENLDGRKLPTPGKSVDKHLAVFRKGKCPGT